MKRSGGRGRDQRERLELHDRGVLHRLVRISDPAVRIHEDELKGEQDQLAGVRRSLYEEQQNPELVAVVRMAQATADPTPSQQVELRNKLEKASGRIRGLQATAAEHEKNIEALKKELGALKP